MRPLHFVPERMFVALCGKGASRIRYVSTREDWDRKGGRQCASCAKAVELPRRKEEGANVTDR